MHHHRLMGIVVATLMASTAQASQQQVAQTALKTADQGSTPPRTSQSSVSKLPSTPEIDAGSRSVAARARMLECGHQWSNMKRTGTATGTWKDFSRGCLAQR